MSCCFMLLQILRLSIKQSAELIQFLCDILESSFLYFFFPFIINYYNLDMYREVDPLRKKADI